ncbi:unnamed protein product [Didymodactylos carnosus]|uniref:Bulb-type lectin domain-containing protein n=1 Tax=Didymodactylos carnosus TaxID=1234261 RepID=A0A815P9J7_9BILA|nr:unnamed protein product [Didymodactylos carnosus]CAF1445973.1 unnamed protein product [Didymodactylos carnosus]CAF4077879.1 unnamed protein product [Didymodactylos carnosus]CAF4320597.1 unnamed protein product [Didymodactylos carnosus]
MQLYLLVVVLLLFIHHVSLKPIDTKDEVLKYLTQLGYSKCEPESKVSCSIDFSSILRDYQKTFGLQETGQLDKPTKKLLNKPRCGNKDSPVSSSSSLLALRNSKWSKSHLRWTLRNSSSRISHAQSLNIIRDAFEHWTKHIPLRIEQVCEACEADVVFTFGPIDGPSTTLAYAHFPEDGRVHFDSDENWIERFDHDGTNLFLVAVHEIGHALGLSHNKEDTKSIMYPMYQLIPKRDILPNIDRQRITDKYGACSSDGGSTLNEGVLNEGQTLQSNNGLYKVYMQTDGNLCVYTRDHAVWCSGTQNHSPGQNPFRLGMQPDGNLVIYSKRGPIWASGTMAQGNGPYQLIMQDDRNLVLYDGDAKPLWASDTKLA